jgi:hypothetical protein
MSPRTLRLARKYGAHLRDAVGTDPAIIADNLGCGLLYGGIRQPSLFITGVDQRAMEAPHPIDLASSATGCGDGQEAQKFFYAEQ